jgi:ABC-type Fe3+ transport system permease subunit
MKNIKPYAPAIAWGIFIFALSVWPGKDFPQLDWGDLLSVDKLVHITFYALLTALILRGPSESENFKVKKGENASETIENRRKTIRFAVITALCCTAYGWFLEWFQENYCQDRLFDWFDGLANTIGAFGALGVFIWRSRK